MNPLPIGTMYDGKRIVEVVDCDHEDNYQPHLYRLDDGTTVWIPRFTIAQAKGETK
jgi:hypothetical protein